MNTKRILSLTVILMSFSLMGMAQEKRQVTVSGVPVTITEIQSRDRLYCESDPNGQIGVHSLTERWGDREKSPSQKDIFPFGAKELSESEEGLLARQY